MKNFALQLSSEDWMILEFSQLGFIGKAFDQYSALTVSSEAGSVCELLVHPTNISRWTFLKVLVFFTASESGFTHSNISFGIHELRKEMFVLFQFKSFKQYFSYCFVVFSCCLNVVRDASLQQQWLIPFCCRKNVSGSRPKSNCGVHIHVLQGKAHWLAAGPHPLGQSLQSWKRCGMNFDRSGALLDSQCVLKFFLILSAETLWASEV